MTASWTACGRVTPRTRLTARWSAGRGSSGAAQTGPASRTGGSRVHLELSTKLREVFTSPRLSLNYRVSGLSCPEAGGCKSAIL